jgi:tRNA(Ile)-lysidine synthase
MFEEELHRGLMKLNMAGRGILLAVSGGADSIAMLHATIRLRDRLPLERIEVAHFNHGLRGHESDVDSEFVKTTSAKLQLICHIQTASPGALTQASRGSLEETARKARYAFIESVADQRGLSQVATAHHLQDQHETVLFNLLRGTGLRGIGGIPQTRQISSTLRIIRPMLHIERASIRQWLREEGLEFREDASNEEMKFTRNRIRRIIDLLPAPERHGLVSRLGLLSQQAGTTIECLDIAANRILDSAVLESSTGSFRMSRSRLLALPEPLVRHALNFAWASAHWPQQKMTREHWLRLSQTIFRGTPRRSMYPAAVELHVRRDIVVLMRTADSEARVSFQS